MNQETDSKIDSIIISAVNRLYDKEANRGLDYDDLKCLEILYKIKKEANTTSVSPVSSTSVPDNLIDLLRAVKGRPGDDNGN